MRETTVTWTALVKPALIAAALTALALPAPTAHGDADPVSIAAYIHALNMGHVPYDNAGRMVDIANTVCRQARGGTDPDSIVETVAANGFTAQQAGIIMGAAGVTFCPDMEPAFNRWSNSPN
jgi:Protein of unknown function (DUF732)